MDYLTNAQKLACDAWQLIYRDPSLLEQKTWRSAQKTPKTRCGTKLCWGGHVVALDDGQFITSNSSSRYFNCLLARPEDDQRKVQHIQLGPSYDNTKIDIINVRDRLLSIFKIANEDLDAMTNAYNNIADIRQGIIDKLGVDPMTRTLVKKQEQACSCGIPGCSFYN